MNGAAAAAGAWKHARRFGSLLGHHSLDLLLPPHCPTCDTIVDRQGSFCPACFVRAPFVAEPCCERCGSPFAGAQAGDRSLSCAACRAQAPAWRAARAAFIYDAHSQRMILPLKYADRTENAVLLATHMHRAGARLLEAAEIIVPVPLHRWRLFSRRYNQSALIARRLARLSGRALVVDALRRPQATSSLAGQGARARRATMAAAIVINPARIAAIEGRAVVLVDDVLTTGATADACAKALYAAGARSVDVLVAARTLQDAAGQTV